MKEDRQRLESTKMPPSVILRTIGADMDNKTERTPQFCRNSVLTFLLFCLVIFNLAFLFRGFLVLPQNAALVKLCRTPSFTGTDKPSNSSAIDVAFFAKYAFRNMKIVRGIDRTMSSILRNTDSPIHLHVLLDLPSKNRVRRTLYKVYRRFNRRLGVTFYDVTKMAQNFSEIIATVRQYFFSKDVGRYNDDIFFMSEIFHRAFPEAIEKLIFLDTDLKFLTDIRELQELFDKFQPSNVIGIGPDLQPQYRMDFARFRVENPDTHVGSQRPGKQGFNTGVTLFNLKRMRESGLYNALLNETVVADLCKKYQFRGYLGHQDFFTLTGMEYPELYYELDCSWNRQLDTGWLQNVGHEVFDLYHRCQGEVKVYHGNGNANIPGD